MHPSHGRLSTTVSDRGHQVRVFYPNPPAWKGFAVHGIGVREWMPATAIDRPRGTGDYLLMAFHQPVDLSRKGTSETPTGSNVVVFSPNAPQRYGSASGPWLHSWLHCDGKWFTDELGALGVPLDQPIMPFDPTFFEHTLLDLHHELSAEVDPDPEVARQLVSVLLRRIVRAARPASASSLVPPAFAALKRYLDDNFPEKLTLRQLARQVPCSVPHLCAEFKRYYGAPPIEYVIQLRLHCARMLLADSTQSVGGVARAVGYEDANQFSRLFRRHYGVSPRASRGAPKTARLRKA